MNRVRKNPRVLLREIAWNTGERMPEILLGLLFLLGIFLGALMYRYMDERMRMTLQLIFQSGIEQTDGTFGFSIFFSDAVLLAVVFFCGFCAIAQPVIFAIPVFKGLGNGLVLGNLYAVWGFAAVPYICVKLLPHYLVYTIILISACREAYFLSRRISGQIRGGSGPPLRITAYIIKFLWYMLVTFIVCMISSYLLSRIPIRIV